MSTLDRDGSRSTQGKASVHSDRPEKAIRNRVQRDGAVAWRPDTVKIKANVMELRHLGEVGESDSASILWMRPSVRLQLILRVLC